MTSNIQAAANALYSARESRKPINQISTEFGVTSLEDAYAVSAINNQARVNNGGRIIGKKVGLTSLSVQKQLGVD